MEKVKKEPKELWVMRYETKWGIEVYPVIVERKLPKITNELLKKIGIVDPELEEADEAEWVGPFRLKSLPKVIGPRDWYPEAELEIAILMVYSKRGEHLALIPAWVLGKTQAPHVNRELLRELEPYLEDEEYLEGERVDLNDTQWIGPIKLEEIPRV